MNQATLHKNHQKLSSKFTPQENLIAFHNFRQTRSTVGIETYVNENGEPINSPQPPTFPRKPTSHQILGFYTLHIFTETTIMKEMEPSSVGNAAIPTEKL